MARSIPYPVGRQVQPVRHRIKKSKKPKIMTTINQTTISKDVANKKLIVSREFDAPLAQVWKAWTESSLLDQWWAPRPWKAVTKTMDFRDGGHWLYYMLGPDGTKQWCRADFKSIIPQKSFSLIDVFCNQEGETNTDFPKMDWENKFSETSSGTMVKVEISFATVADMDKILEMGFKEGFTAAHGNLDELLASQLN